MISATCKTGEAFPLLVRGRDRYESLDEAMTASLPILGKIIADLARRDRQEQGRKSMGRRRKALQSSLELTEDQYFQSLETIDSDHGLVRTVKGQLVTRECLEILNDLGEVIQAWASYSDFVYWHSEE